jgi:hypothetical protein
MRQVSLSIDSLFATSQYYILSYLVGDKKSTKKTSHQQKLNHLTSSDVNIEHRDDGNVLIAQEIFDALGARISWGLLTP